MTTLTVYILVSITVTTAAHDRVRPADRDDHLTVLDHGIIHHHANSLLLAVPSGLNNLQRSILIAKSLAQGSSALNDLISDIDPNYQHPDYPSTAILEDEMHSLLRLAQLSDYTNKEPDADLIRKAISSIKTSLQPTAPPTAAPTKQKRSFPPQLSIPADVAKALKAGAADLAIALRDNIISYNSRFVQTLDFSKFLQKQAKSANLTQLKNAISEQTFYLIHNYLPMAQAFLTRVKDTYQNLSPISLFNMKILDAQLMSTQAKLGAHGISLALHLAKDMTQLSFTHHYDRENNELYYVFKIPLVITPPLHLYQFHKKTCYAIEKNDIIKIVPALTHDYIATDSIRFMPLSAKGLSKCRQINNNYHCPRFTPSTDTGSCEQALLQHNSTAIIATCRILLSVPHSDDVTQIRSNSFLVASPRTSDMHFNCQEGLTTTNVTGLNYIDTTNCSSVKTKSLTLYGTHPTHSQETKIISFQAKSIITKVSSLSIPELEDSLNTKPQTVNTLTPSKPIHSILLEPSQYIMEVLGSAATFGLVFTIYAAQRLYHMARGYRTPHHVHHVRNRRLPNFQA